jgi:hypothetical protein
MGGLCYGLALDSLSCMGPSCTFAFPSSISSITSLPSCSELVASMLMLLPFPSYPYSFLLIISLCLLYVSAFLLNIKLYNLLMKLELYIKLY